MASKVVAVRGVFRNDAQAEGAVERLRESGFPPEDISPPVVNENGVQLSVRCDSPVSATRAENLLKQTGAKDVASA